VILKACESDPRRRYHSAREMHEELALLECGQSVRQKRAATRRWAIASKLGVVALTLALLTLAWAFLRGLSQGHIPDPQTLRLYEDGRWHYSQLTPEDHVKALELLTQAVQRDPKFVQPYAELTALHVWGMLPGDSSDPERLQQMRAIYSKAVAIDPNSAEAHIALSFSHFLERDWRGAESEVVRAIARNPKLAIPHDLYTFYLECLERFEEAHREARRAEALEPPGSLRLTAIVGAWPYIGERRFNGAIAQLQRVMQLDKRFANGHFYLWLCYEAQSNYVAAIEEFRQAGLMFGLDEKQVTADYDALRGAYTTLGEKGFLRKWIELVEAEASLPPEKRGISGDCADSDLAGHYARLGEKEKALDELEKYFDEPNVWQQVKFLPLHDSLRGEPRFQALVKRAGLPQ
jgi:tetratricopeptide (TPR) repeat protein